MTGVLREVPGDSVSVLRSREKERRDSVKTKQLAPFSVFSLSVALPIGSPQPPPHNGAPRMHPRHTEVPALRW